MTVDDVAKRLIDYGFHTRRTPVVVKSRSTQRRDRAACSASGRPACPRTLRGIGFATTAVDILAALLGAVCRQVAEDVEETDPVTHDLLITQLGQLELFHWFIRAHLENSGGELSTSGASTETAAATKATRGRRKS